MAKKKYNISAWLSAYRDNQDTRFIQVGNSLLFDKSFQSLKATTKNLYYCMAMESGGNINFVFPEKAFKKYGIPHTTGRRGIEELIANHFIKRVSGKATRENNDFSFCLDWKKENGYSNLRK